MLSLTGTGMMKRLVGLACVLHACALPMMIGTLVLLICLNAAPTPFIAS